MSAIGQKLEGSLASPDLYVSVILARPQHAGDDEFIEESCHKMAGIGKVF